MELKLKPAALLLLLALWCCCSAQRIDYVSPHRGSYNGATRLTIVGDGFAQENQFQLNPADDTFGNRVTLVSDTLSVPCDVERDSTHGKQVMCYTRAMPKDQYVVHVSVDGVPIPDSSICGGNPNITSAASISYMGGMPCELIKPNSDELSLPDKKLYRVTTIPDKLSMFQTFAEVTGVSPSNGSVMGGTLLTIQGRFFDQTDRPARVLVGGRPCEIQSVSDESITCRTARQDVDMKNMTVYPGGRGLKIELWNMTKPRHLIDIYNYDENTTGYWTNWIDSLPYAFPDIDYFSGLSKGFFVPPTSSNYTIYLNCDDRCDLYLSNSSRPEDKARTESLL
ncbi:Fibrocystin-L Polycystic kidney and hepatic disease 1-like protein 1 [Collichthys lucidus]|uniref:Fibrocystin-L Polycystic kidney and hepatic disease 1-like protein 1 n=1 Tax=Collichthys lucidus TaxID=240159 RepID=A0A4U5VL06_COLLU|nr:Fibrocystin-L Polycystic kidney and hepatic disease 1-like protein 1 [Collichthys lucidus]